jgi:hypothetical protein
LQLVAIHIFDKCCIQALCEVMEKNHDHLQLPHLDLTKPYSEDRLEKALETYDLDELKNFSLATDEEIEGAWGPVEVEKLENMEVKGLRPDDKEKLLAEEAKLNERLQKKMERQEQLKNLPTKAHRVNLSTVKKQKEKQKEKAPQPRPTTPPSNQLALNADDIDKTPKASGSSGSFIIIRFSLLLNAAY